MKLIYPLYSKRSFYFHEQITRFVLEQNGVQLNAFMTNIVEPHIARNANYNLIRRSDEIWVFGPVSGEVLAQIKLAQRQGKPLRYYAIVESREILHISEDEAESKKILERRLMNFK